jgi:hypothetical protein
MFRCQASTSDFEASALAMGVEVSSFNIQQMTIGVYHVVSSVLLFSQALTASLDPKEPIGAWL